MKPYRPPEADINPTSNTALALKALGKGQATEAQQKTALRYIFELCGLIDFENPDLDAEARAFTGGKRAVGMVLAYLTKTPVLGGAAGTEPTDEAKPPPT